LPGRAPVVAPGERERAGGILIAANDNGLNGHGITSVA
jgi:hypothetical protein